MTDATGGTGGSMAGVGPSDLRDVPGILVGHWTDADAATGCTVILAPERAVAGVDVRGSAPGTRETDLLRPTALVDRVDAVLLSGGSAFGLAAADGVMRWLAERGRGFATGIRPVPIVPAAVIFDLGTASADAHPGADAGYAACDAAERGDAPLEGRVGVGSGATVGKLLGTERATRTGVGSAGLRLADGSTVAALAVTNAVGNVLARDGSILAGVSDGAGSFLPAGALLLRGAASAAAAPPGGNTTLAVVATDAALDRAQCRKLAELAHDALARAIDPVHTMLDGDTVFVLSTAAPTAPPVGVEQQLVLGVAAVEVLRTAIERSAMPRDAIGQRIG